MAATRKQNYLLELVSSTNERHFVLLLPLKMNVSAQWGETKTDAPGTSLVVQWLRIHLPMQGTRVQALVREDPTSRGATKPVHHNYWAFALEPSSHNYWSPHAWSPCSATREATTMRSPRTATKSSPRSPQLEKARAQQRRPNAAKNK